MSSELYFSFIINKKNDVVRTRAHEIRSERDSFVHGFNSLPKKVRGPRKAYTQEEYDERVASEATVGRQTQA